MLKIDNKLFKKLSSVNGIFLRKLCITRDGYVEILRNKCVNLVNKIRRFSNIVIFYKKKDPTKVRSSRHKNAPCWSATSCSPTDYSAVPSALGGLTSGFGMGPGVPPLPWSLTNKGYSCFTRVSHVP